MKGNTLIEALAALSIIAIVISSIAAAVILSLSNASFTKNKTSAAGYAQQGMELMRQLRSDDYDTFRTYDGTYCLGKGETVLGVPQSSCDTQNVDTFIRTINVDQSPGCGANVAKVMVEVAWSDGKCKSADSYCHKEVNTSCFSTVNPLKPL